MKRTSFSLLGAFVGFAALLYGPFPALAQIAPPLGVVQQFSALGNSGVTGSTGLGTVVNGDVGSSPTATISNFPPSSATPPFTVHQTNDLTVQQTHTDATAAYNFLAVQGPGTVIPDQLNAQVLTSGIYSFASGAADLANGGTLTLNGPGIFIFQVNSTLTANTLSNVVGTADPCNVFWRVGTSATLLGITFLGNVIADASITVGSGADLTGRAIAGTGPTGAVTMSGAGGNTIGGCALLPNGSPCTSGSDCASGICNSTGTCGSLPAPAPALTPWALLAAAALLAGVAAFALRRRATWK
jgi:hypothetical protein